MERYTLKEKDIYTGSLILINKENPLKTQIDINSLERFSDNYENILINKTANKYLQFILRKINAGTNIVAVSGYRSFDEQQKIFADSIKENGDEYTRKFVALPNASEHQSGLAIDLGQALENNDSVSGNNIDGFIITRKR